MWTLDSQDARHGGSGSDMINVCRDPFWISAAPVSPNSVSVFIQEVHQSNEGWSPVYLEDNLAVMSIGASGRHPSR